MKIGRLSKLDPRKLWSGEATDFTPWLAKEENIALLSETIGLDLEVISEEKNVGPFRADILCKNTIDDSFVLIENQLEKTDHTHLGQLLTYAAGLEAVAIIWIAKTFTEEHRAALDWLNRMTDENLRFFGIELEVYQIGDSLPAPQFQLVSKPNDWSKSVKTGKRDRGKMTETKKLNLEYWTSMKEYLEQENTKFSIQTPKARYFTNFPLGRSKFKLSLTSSVKDNFVRVEFVLTGDEATRRFLELQEKYEKLSYEEISPKLIWEEIEDYKTSWVYIQKHFNVSNRDDWEKQFDWAVNNLEKMDTFFRSKIKGLK